MPVIIHPHLLNNFTETFYTNLNSTTTTLSSIVKTLTTTSTITQATTTLLNETIVTDNPINSEEIIIYPPFSFDLMIIFLLCFLISVLAGYFALCKCALKGKLDLQVDSETGNPVNTLYMRNPMAKKNRSSDG